MNKPTAGSGAPGRPSDPRRILEDDALSDQQKRDYLEDWRLDLLERQTATAENMPAGSEATSNDVAEQLRQVTLALEALNDTN